MTVTLPTLFASCCADRAGSKGEARQGPARDKSLGRWNRKERFRVLHFRYGPVPENNRRGVKMKTTTILAIALGLG
jgi:hypothetical protein